MINNYDTFIASSRTFSFVEPPHSQFKLLAEKILEEPELCNATNEMRVVKRTELVRIISDVLQERPRDHWLRKLRGVGCVTNFLVRYSRAPSDTHRSGVPFGPINRIKETFEHPQAQVRGMVVVVEMGFLVFPGFSLSSSECWESPASSSWIDQIGGPACDLQRQANASVTSAAPAIPAHDRGSRNKSLMFHHTLILRVFLTQV